MRRWPAAWACRACATSSRTSPSRSSIRMPTRPSPIAARAAAPARAAACSIEIERGADRRSCRGRHRGRGLRAARRSPIRSGARWSSKQHRRFEQLSDIFGFRVLVDSSTNATGRSASSTAPGAPCRAGSRTTSRRRSRTTTARFTPPSSARITCASNCRSAPATCTRSPSAGWPRTRSTRTSQPLEAEGREPPAAESNAYRWLRRLVDMLSEGDNPEGIPRAYQARAVPRPGLLLHAQGRLIALPKGATPIDFAYAVHTDIGNSCVGCRDQRPPCAADDRAERMATRSRSFAPSPGAARRPGRGLRSPARRGRQSAAPPARRCATNMPGLGREIMERVLISPRAASYSEKDMAHAIPKLGIKNVEDGWRRSAGASCRAAEMLRAMGSSPDAAAKRKPRRDGRQEAGSDAISGSRRRRRCCRSAFRPQPAPCPASGSSAS